MPEENEIIKERKKLVDELYTFLQSQKLGDKTLWTYCDTDCLLNLEQFILTKLKERDEQWETAVMYNVDAETWKRIKDAMWALNKPKENEIIKKQEHDHEKETQKRLLDLGKQLKFDHEILLNAIIDQLKSDHNRELIEEYRKGYNQCLKDQKLTGERWQHLYL